jgi:hypothetical protein
VTNKIEKQTFTNIDQKTFFLGELEIYATNVIMEEILSIFSKQYEIKICQPLLLQQNERD